MSETKKPETAKAPKLNLSNTGEASEKKKAAPVPQSIGFSGTLKRIDN